MKRTPVYALALTALLAAPVLQAEDGDMLLRARGLYVSPADKSDANPAAGLGKDAIHISGEALPEIDFSYFVTKNLAAEVAVTYPRTFDVKMDGQAIGSFKMLPSTLTAQWHFLPGGTIDPYVGAGVNLTIFSSVDLARKLDVDTTSVGFAAQAGADFNVTSHWTINVDAKWLTIRPNMTSVGTTVTTVKVDPWLIGAGVGSRF